MLGRKTKSAHGTRNRSDQVSSPWTTSAISACWDRTEKDFAVVEHLQSSSDRLTITPRADQAPSVAVPMLMTAEVRNPVIMDCEAIGNSTSSKRVSRKAPVHRPIRGLAAGSSAIPQRCC